MTNEGTLEATKGSGSKIVELLRAGHPYSGTTDDVDLQAAACIEDLAEALRNIAAYDDRPASEHLEKTGSWGQFDEPGGAQIARATLGRWGLK